MCREEKCRLFLHASLFLIVLISLMGSLHEKIDRQSHDDTLTAIARVQLINEYREGAQLYKTVDAYRNATNYISGYVYRSLMLNPVIISENVKEYVKCEFHVEGRMLDVLINKVVDRYTERYWNYEDWEQQYFPEDEFYVLPYMDENVCAIETADRTIEYTYFFTEINNVLKESDYEIGMATVMYEHSRWFIDVPITLKKKKNGKDIHVLKQLIEAGVYHAWARECFDEWH